MPVFFETHAAAELAEFISFCMQIEFTSLPLITAEAAIGTAKDILDDKVAQLGFAPNMYQALANSPGYLSTYIHGYNAFREGSGFSPQEQELIFLVISREKVASSNYPLCGMCLILPLNLL